MSEQKQNEWIAPLVRALMASPVVEETHGPMTCPICDCDHQIFEGMGILAPDKTGTKLVCAFPSTETLAKIDLPADIKIGGLTSYVRYSCGCNGHRWAMITAFLKDHTMAWCADLTPPKKGKKCKGDPQPFPQGDPSLMGPLQQLIQGMAAGGHKPILMLGPGIVGSLPPGALEQLQAQGAQVGQPKLPPPNLPPGEGPPPVLDHEDPLSRMPAICRYAWQNWPDAKPLPESQIMAFQLPKLLRGQADPSGPPWLAVGTNDGKMFQPMQEWLFALAVELKPETRSNIHAMVYWDRLLLLVTAAPAEVRKTLAHEIAEAVIDMGKFKPDLYMLAKRDYSVLVKSKAVEAAKKGK